VTRLLASIARADEVEAALGGGADLVDVKDPAAGALGAAPEATIREIVTLVAGRRPVSATVGDLPLDATVLAHAARRTARCGVDFVKLGLFPGGDLDGSLTALAVEAQSGIRLVAVLFADSDPERVQLDQLAAAGFAGAMLDTADKTSGSLTRHLGLDRLAQFVAHAKALGLLVGLAGSLGEEDVPRLAPLGVDYLGFRGALCRGGRDGSLDVERVRRVRQRLAAASNATAAAGADTAARSATSGAPSTRVARSA